MNAIEQYLPVLQSAVQNYEKDHPHWHSEVLLSLIKWGLKSLKHYIEDVRDYGDMLLKPGAEVSRAVARELESIGDPTDPDALQGP